MLSPYSERELVFSPLSDRELLFSPCSEGEWCYQLTYCSEGASVVSCYYVVRGNVETMYEGGASVVTM